MSFPLVSTLELGLIYALVALGVFLTFRIINFPDLTVDGTFPLGAAVAAIFITNGHSPIVATLFATASGLLAGSVTGWLHVNLRIMGLLAGILTMTALYSVNMRVMGRPNLALLDLETLFSSVSSEFFIILGIVLVGYFIIYYFLKSQYGLGMRATGINPTVSRSYGIKIGKTTLFALAISNGLVALAGALFAQSQGFADVSLGTGTIIIGLASVMIGEALFGRRCIFFDLLGCLLGSIIYRIAIAVALNSQLLGLEASDLNILTAIIVTIALILPKMKGMFS